MVFWRKKNNAPEQEQEERDDRLLHPPGAPEIEPSTDAEDSDISEDVRHDIEESGREIIEELRQTPTPEHTRLDDARTASEDRQHDVEEEGGGWLSRLAGGLSKSSNKLGQGLGDIFTKQKLDEKALEQLEELLISADLGPATAAQLVETLRAARFGKETGVDEAKAALVDAMAKILEPVARPVYTEKLENGPFTFLIVGVNGVGKTTTIAKLAHDFTHREHKKVMIAAGDTFRAAAVEQLDIWAKRAHADFYARDIGADAAAVAFEAYEKAKEKGSDVLMIDTAGRLHNQANLMAELEKIIRVLKKQDESLPHEVLLVLDATTGQNAHAQVETFQKMVNISGLIVTKLDGSAKGGVVVSLADRFKLPIVAVGVGEQMEDLQPFHPREFAESLLG